MTAKQVKSLKMGDKLQWKADGMHGEVVEVGYNAAKVQWADGSFGILHPSRLSQDREYRAQVDVVK